MSAIAGYFDKIYIINLPTRLDRRKEMTRQLANVALSLEDPAVRLFPGIRPSDAGEFPTIGGRGNFLSHMEVLRDACKAGHNKILIFEDDLDFSRDFNRRIDRTIAGLSTRRWSLFYGGYIGVEPGPADEYGLSAFPPDRSILHAHFIGFQGATLSRMLAHLETLASRRKGDPRGGPMMVDGAYSWYRRMNPDEVTLAVVPPLGYQRSSRTDNDDLRWFDRMPVARSAVAVMRRIKNAALRLRR